MLGKLFSSQCLLHGAAIAGSALLTAPAALAGGFAVPNQSAQFQGSSFAGSAAGGGLSSSFWNSAAMAEAGRGTTLESHTALIVPDIGVTTLPGTVVPTGTSGVGRTVDIDRPALVGASYGAYRINPSTVLGIAINSPFGLGSEASDPNWAGQYHGRSAKALTVNVNPILAFNLMPGLAIGIGAQIEYARLKFKAAPSGLPAGHPSAGLDVDDIGFGATAGVLWQPMAGTSIGLGYRSQVTHKLEGSSYVVGGLARVVPGFFELPFTPFGIQGTVTLPEIVTLSLRQALSPTTRLLGTVEWTHWSRLGTVNFFATSPGGVLGSVQQSQVASSFVFNWHDGWFFALGGEHDWQPNLTVRAGASYQISPIRNAAERTPLIPDSNTISVSLGATYKHSETLSFDIGYSHVFFRNAPISQSQTASIAPMPLVAAAQSGADIVTVGIKMKLGGS